MTIGALSFLFPWLLAALVSLPLIYWLLRAIPPRPRQVEFPPTRILKDIKNKEKTPAKTPWWLLLIRLLAAALIIIALAEPILNPKKSLKLDGSGPVAIVIDNGWPSATHWDDRMEKADRLISTAQSQSRPVIVIATATPQNAPRALVQTPGEARATLRGLTPQPFAPDIMAAVNALKTTLAASKDDATSGTNVLWLTDGIDHSDNTATALEEFAKIAGAATFAIFTDDKNPKPLALGNRIEKGGLLTAVIKRTGGPARTGSATAYTARGESLSRVTFKFDVDQQQTSATFDIPLELRNQVSRIAIDGLRSAGALSLLDARSQWRRVALISSEGAESAQPLLAPLYYLQKALAPYSQIIQAGDPNILTAIDDALKSNVDILVLADIGTLSDAAHTRLQEWVESGGVLVRFAGPRMEQATDELLPVPLRVGGRTLGGALSWSTPQKLAEFEETSPFAGLKVSKEITVSRQVLADPARLPPNAKIWARLVDGTPLVTATSRGNGELILFHVTANSDWSNLPISGLFVDMLKQILTLGNASVRQAVKSKTSADTQNKPGNNTAPDSLTRPTSPALSGNTAALVPTQTLDGYGKLRSPPPNAQPILASEFAQTTVNRDHPPGYYGTDGTPRALNIANEKTVLKKLPALPSGASVEGFGNQTDKPLKPGFLSAALALVFLDIIAVLFLQGFGSLLTTRSRKASTAAAWLTVAFTGSSLALLAPIIPAHAQQNPGQQRALDAHAQQATNNVTFGYVLTGDTSADTTSRLGLTGLGYALARRTSVTPGTPIGVDIINDEIAFYPVLYWPILKDTRPLPEHVLAKIDAYMKQGGLIIFDTKDFGFGHTTGFTGTGAQKTPLQILLGQLDIPRLEPVPPGHVLTKSFYLLANFPGRWAGGELWVEAGAGQSSAGQSGARTTTSNDGVTSIMITPNDFAAAWAIDKRGRPIYPTVSTARRQREMAFRTGINIVMHALTGNYKADQVHIPSLLQRLGQ